MTRGLIVTAILTMTIPASAQDRAWCVAHPDTCVPPTAAPQYHPSPVAPPAQLGAPGMADWQRRQAVQQRAIGKTNDAITKDCSYWTDSSGQRHYNNISCTE